MADDKQQRSLKFGDVIFLKIDGRQAFVSAHDKTVPQVSIPIMVWRMSVRASVWYHVDRIRLGFGAGRLAGHRPRAGFASLSGSSGFVSGACAPRGSAAARCRRFLSRGFAVLDKRTGAVE